MNEYTKTYNNMKLIEKRWSKMIIYQMEYSVKSRVKIMVVNKNEQSHSTQRSIFNDKNVVSSLCDSNDLLKKWHSLKKKMEFVGGTKKKTTTNNVKLATYNKYFLCSIDLFFHYNGIICRLHRVFSLKQKEK